MNVDLKGVCLLDKMDEFEGLVAEYERETGKKLEDDVKIGVVVMVMDAGPLRRHLLLHIEKCDRYDEFRGELETLAMRKKCRRAQQ